MDSQEQTSIAFLQERRQQILEKLHREGKVLAPDLAALFAVSEDTIRRDLREMAAAGLLQRVHGGALPRSPSTAGYEIRQRQPSLEKSGIAQAAANLITNDQVVLFDDGTTSLEVAKCLSPHLRATAITNSPPIAMTLANYAEIEVIVIGGKLFKREMSVCGAFALEQVQALRADVCILGVCGLHPDVGITTAQFEELHLKRTMITNSADVVAVVTAEKLGSASPYVVAPIRSLTHLVTSWSVTKDVIAPYQEMGITVIQA